MHYMPAFPPLHPNAHGDSLFLTRTSNGHLSAIGTPDRQINLTHQKLRALAVDSLRGVAYLVTDSKKLLTFNIGSRSITNTRTLTFKPAALAVDPELWK